MKIWSKNVCIISILLLFGCTMGTLKMEETDSWLMSMSEGKSPQINITGLWYDARGNAVFGWGEGYLVQEGNQIDGSIGVHNVKGTVSGKTVYLVIIYGGSVYYTAKLELVKKGLLLGNYFYADDKMQEVGRPISLAKKQDINE